MKTSRGLWFAALSFVIASLAGCKSQVNPLEQLARSLPGAAGTAAKPAPRPSQPGNVSQDASGVARRGSPSVAAASQSGRRYQLEVSRLISEKDGGEINSLKLDQRFSDERPVPLKVLRTNGYRGQLVEVPLEGVGGTPPYIKCAYLLEEGGKRGAPLVRDVKYWHAQKPAIQSTAAYADLIDLKIADVAVERCPANWGDALALALGDQAYAKVKLRPAPGRQNALESASLPPSTDSAQSRANATVSSSGEPLSFVEMCDNAAGHPDDPEAFNAGIADEQIDAGFAIGACERAVKDGADAPRIVFQLARAYLAADRREEAIEKLLAAAEKGHGASLAYLADFQMDGGAGLEPDPSLARALYQRAVESGFVPAKKILAEFEDYTDRVAEAEREERSGKTRVASATTLPFVPTGTKYRVPLVMDNILKGDLNAVGHNEVWSKYFLVEVASAIGFYCQAQFGQEQIDDLRRRAALSSIDVSPGGGMVVMLNEAERMIIAMANPKAAVEFERREELEGEQVMLDREEEAAHDAIVLLSRHGCSGNQIEAFKKNSLSFIDGEGAPRLNADRLLGNCVANSPNGNRALLMQFCSCVTRKMATARMTRAERTSLMSSFMPAAQSIADRQLDHFQSCR